MSLSKILSYANAYFLWFCAAAFVAALLCLREMRAAHTEQAQTIFALERELAVGRQRRARNALCVIVALLAVLTVAKSAIVPGQELPRVREPTPTQMLILVPTATPETPTPTRTRIPTRPRPTPAPVTETPSVTPVPTLSCPQPGVCIASPAAGQAVQGQVTIRGTANINAFQFYKLEYGQGEEPQRWNSIGEIQRAPVVDGVLGTWDTTGFPAGVYRLRLTVVDISGNFPPPYEIRLVIQP